MSWIAAAIFSQIILGTSAIFDKGILKKRFLNPPAYAFWLAILGLSAVLLLPFGFQAVSLKLILIAALAGAFFVLGMLFLFYGLNLSEASQTLPVIGGISPIFALTFSYFLIESRISAADFLVFSFLILGAAILFFTEKKEIRKSAFVFILASAAFLGISVVLNKIVFEQSNFITGFFWIKIGAAIPALILLFFKNFRREILNLTRQSPNRHRLLYLSNRAYAGAGSVLFNFAIFLGSHPALVDAIQSFKYVVIFLAAWLILKERFRGKILFGKILATIFIFLGIFLLGIINYAKNIPVDAQRNIAWGISYSAKFSRQLGLDWQKNYEAILNELKPEKVRLVIYWDQTEKERGEFNFSETDWLLDKAREYKTPVILALGMKVPRWPECHLPEWIGEMPTNEKEEFLRYYLKTVISRYKDEPIIEMWQIENEPFLTFGECPKRGKDFLEKEIALIKLIDPERPVITTDGGEFGLWYKAAKNGDVFGTTMYRKVHIKLLGWLFENVEYPLGPEYFRLKEKAVRFLINDFTKKFIVVELQAEPWSRFSLGEISYEEQLNLFDFDYFKETIKYAEEAGFNEYYFWGAEWWYNLNQNDDGRFWDYAKTIFNN
jgi:drug/metabolite transporter (DMT)-like permease